MRQVIVMAVCLVVLTSFLGCGEKQQSEAPDQQAVNEPRAVAAQPLKSKLDEQRNRFRAQASPEAQEIMEKAQADLMALHLEEKALKVGDKIPLFALPGADGATVSLADMLKQGPVVIAFYRGSWCPYCNLELKALQDALPQIEKLGGSLVAISPELPDSALTAVEKNALEYPVLSDTGLHYAAKCGLVFEMSEPLDSLYRAFGLDVKAWNHAEKARLPIPTTYVVGTDGAIRYAYVNVDYTQRAEPSAIIATLNQLKQQ